MKCFALFTAVLLSATLLATAAPAASTPQPADPAKSGQHKGERPGEAIKERLENQHKRIEEGIKKGQLTPDEVTQLQSLEDKIRDLLANFKANGKFTKAELEQVRAALKEASKQIFTDRHNQEGATAKTKNALKNK